MNSAVSTQMNIRIDASLKKHGDDALSSIGFTPTQAVRALWEHAAKRGEQLEEVKRFLEGSEPKTGSTAPEESALSAGRSIVPDGLASLDITLGDLAQTLQDESALYDAAMLERAQHKGWL